MKISNSFTVPVGREKAMELLTDVPMIAPCIPGAELGELVSENNYRGELKVRLGPIALTFAGTAKISDIDHDANTAILFTKGADKKGRGAAEATTLFALSETSDATLVDMQTDLALSGSVAQYGRASGLITEVAKQLTGEFAENLYRLIETQTTGSGAVTDDPLTNYSGEEQSAKPISGFTLILRSWLAMLRRWCGRNARQ